MAVIQDININVHGQPSEKRLQTFLRLSQNENGRMINFRVLGSPLPSGCTATFAGTKPDGNVYSTTGTVTGNFVVIQEDMQMTAVAGVWDAKLDIVNGVHNIMSALIRVTVERDVVDPDAIASDSELQGLVAECKGYAEAAKKESYGSPLVATVKADMTDRERVYVYTGSESGMTAGNWYYWDGSAWTSGGVYNSVAVQTDTTLSVAGKAADGKAAGDAIEELKEDLNAIQSATPEDVGKALKAKTVTDGKVSEWEFGEAGGDAELSEYVDEIASATITEISKRIEFTFTSYEASRGINSSGNVVNTNNANDIVYAFPIAEDAETVGFYAIGRIASNAKYAFYSTDAYADCSSATLIGTVNSYTGATDNIATVPDGAKTLLICSKVDPTRTYYTGTGYISKADANFAPAYDENKIYLLGEYCTHDGEVYKRATQTGIASVWDASDWQKITICADIKEITDAHKTEQSFPTSLFQRGTIDGNHALVVSTTDVIMTNIYHNTDHIILNFADGYVGNVHYYDSDGNYKSHNGWQTGLNYRTIVPNSYFRLEIKKNPTETITDAYIPLYVSKITFTSEYGAMMDSIAQSSDRGLDALCAKMYQKGSAPLTFAKRPCIIVAGQSNIDGRVPVADLPSDFTMPLSNIMAASASGLFSAYNIGSYWDITTSMFAELNKIGSTFYDIKYAVGGTSISEYGDSANHWTPFYENISGGLSKSLLLTFENKIRTTIGANPDTFDVRAFVWQQGEGDRSGTSKQASLSYYKNFKCLVAYVRGIAGNEKLPVICGTVSHLSGQYDPVVEEATLRVAEEDPYMTCIDMSGATLLDSYHFDADSAVYFGRKAYDALIDFGVITGTKINPTPPWENS